MIKSLELVMVRLVLAIRVRIRMRGWLRMIVRLIGCRSTFVEWWLAGWDNICNRRWLELPLDKVLYNRRYLLLLSGFLHRARGWRLAKKR